MYFDRKDDLGFVKWAKAIKFRDHFTCIICDRRGVELNAHHMNSWDWCVDERFDMDNGATLCSTCHHGFHGIYGYGSNTREQFEEYRASCQLLLGTTQRRLAAEDIDRKFQVEAVTEQILRDLDGYQ